MILMLVVPRTIEIVDEHDALALDDRAVGVVLHANAEFANRLGRLNEGAPDIMVANDAEFERQAAFARVADRGRNARVGDRHDHVGVDRGLARQLRAHRLAGVVDRSAMNDRVGPREIDVFEDAGPSRLPRQREEALHPVAVDDHHLAVLDVADEFRPDDVERAGLRAEDRAALELAEHERADAERIARADQLRVGQRHERVRALDLGQGLDETVDDPGTTRARCKQQHDFRVGGRLADGAGANELPPQRQSVGQIAVVGDCEAPGLELGEQRLDIAQHGVAGRRIANVADRLSARQSVDGRRIREVIANQPLSALRVEPHPVVSDDAGGLLAAMLQGMQPERGNGGGVRMVKDTEDAALLAQPVAVGVEAVFAWRTARMRRLLSATYCITALEPERTERSC